MVSLLINHRHRSRLADVEITGVGNVNDCPPVIHVCLQQPIRISETTLNDGVEIKGARYRIKGLVHHRGEGDWTVSVERVGLGGWHSLGKDSVPLQQTDIGALLSGIVLIQLSRERIDRAPTNTGLFLFSICTSFENNSIDNF